VDHQAKWGSVQGNPGVEAVEPTELTRSSVTVEVQVDEPVMLRFSQRRQPGWQVFVNGKEHPLLTLDYLVMGVALPPGAHEVVFVAPKNNYAAGMGGLALVSVLMGLTLIRSERADG
jgi:hypothetical protein